MNESSDPVTDAHSNEMLVCHRHRIASTEIIGTLKERLALLTDADWYGARSLPGRHQANNHRPFAEAYQA